MRKIETNNFGERFVRDSRGYCYFLRGGRLIREYTTTSTDNQGREWKTPHRREVKNVAIRQALETSN